MLESESITYNETVFTILEAARYLGVSRVKVYRLLSENLLTAEIDPLDKRKKLIKRQQLDQLKRRSSKSVA